MTKRAVGVVLSACVAIMLIGPLLKTKAQVNESGAMTATEMNSVTGSQTQDCPGCQNVAKTDCNGVNPHCPECWDSNLQINVTNPCTVKGKYKEWLNEAYDGWNQVDNLWFPSKTGSVVCWNQYTCGKGPINIDSKCNDDNSACVAATGPRFCRLCVDQGSTGFSGNKDTYRCKGCN